MEKPFFWPAFRTIGVGKEVLVKFLGVTRGRAHSNKLKFCHTFVSIRFNFKKFAEKIDIDYVGRIVKLQLFQSLKYQILSG